VTGSAAAPASRRRCRCHCRGSWLAHNQHCINKSISTRHTVIDMHEEEEHGPEQSCYLNLVKRREERAELWCVFGWWLCKVRRSLYRGVTSRRGGQCFSLLGINAKQLGPFVRFPFSLPYLFFKSTFHSLRSCSMVLAVLEIMKLASEKKILKKMFTK
jgi:hypothetical protein